MKRVQVFIGCDLTYTRTGTLVQADETLCIALGPDPDHLTVRELDLTSEWAKELRGRLQAYLDAGHEPGEMDTPAGSSVRKSSPRGRPTSESLRYTKEMRAWADLTGYTQPDGKPGYRKLGGRGGYYHSVALKRDYAGHLTSLTRNRDQLLELLDQARAQDAPPDLDDAEVIG